jgi:glycosyltransferase involved in cell wall biosynthesis
MKVLLLSAYAARSHVHWQRSLEVMLDDWQWCVLSLPPRHFSWRVRGNALYWSIQERAVLEDSYDLVIATSMVDLATLRGLVPALARLPTVVYFHENQFEYPQGRLQHSLLDAQITSIYSALAADCIAFNSQYNRDSFLAGCRALLRKLPDKVPPGVVSALEDKAAVLHVPYDPIFDQESLVSAEPRWPGRSRDGIGNPLRLVWVGRFEHDKCAESLLPILRQLEVTQIDYELAMVGQQFRQSPPVFNDIQSAYSSRLVHFGYIESRMDYRELLLAADIVLSTALHEFQGLAVMEAVASGCLPVVPARLVYPECYPTHFCYGSFPEDPEREANSAVALIRDMAGKVCDFVAPNPDVSQYSVRKLAPLYRHTLASVVSARNSQ